MATKRTTLDWICDYSGWAWKARMFGNGRVKIYATSYQCQAQKPADRFGTVHRGKWVRVKFVEVPSPHQRKVKGRKP